MFELEIYTLKQILADPFATTQARNYVRRQEGLSEWMIDNEPDLFNELARTAKRPF